MTTFQRQCAELALGRIFRMGSRPFQDGDLEEYERCKAIILDAREGLIDEPKSAERAK